MPQNTSQLGTCRAKGCGTPSGALMCPIHLAMVPPGIRQIIAAAAAPDDCPPAILTAAIEAVAHKEQRSAPRTPPKPIQTPRPPAQPVPERRPRRQPADKAVQTDKPVQLALFKL